MSVKFRAWIRGRWWQAADQARLRPPDLGVCDYNKRTIHIPIEGESRADLDVIIHEVLHAALPDISESSITQTASAVARVVWRCGWRRADG